MMENQDDLKDQGNTTPDESENMGETTVAADDLEVVAEDQERTPDHSEEQDTEPQEPFDPEAILEVKAGDLKALQEQATKAVEHWDRLLREKAETENFKKRAARDRQDAIAYANEALLERLLPIMDNFDMALTATEAAETPNVESIRVGVKMIHSQLKSFLSDSGLQEIDAMGSKFDPNIHEALSQEDSEEMEEGTIIQQSRKGYKMKDRLLRPASVVVARKPTES